MSRFLTKSLIKSKGYNPQNQKSHIFVNADKNSRFVWQSGIYVLLLRSHLLLSNSILPIEKTLRATFIKSKL